MHVAYILKELLNSAANVNGEIYIPYEVTKEHLEKLQKSSVSWDVEDFRNVAEWEQGENWAAFYDEAEFEDALYNMIDKHDAELGICWYTVKMYLNMYCRRNSINSNSNEKVEESEMLSPIEETEL